MTRLMYRFMVLDFNINNAVAPGVRCWMYGSFILAIYLFLFLTPELINRPGIGYGWIFIPAFYTVLTWETGRRLVRHGHQRFPHIHYAAKRFRFLVGAGIPISLLTGLGGGLVTFGIILPGKFELQDYVLLTGTHILCCGLVAALHECRYYFRELLLLSGESENLKRQNSNSQFHFLREQIKPHFLFNSLNTLSALIITDPVKAELYVEEMSTVYRYLLSKNEKMLTTLKEELSFLDSYLLLLRVRFEKSLQVTVSTSEEYHEHLLPPFVLQLLIENAVKHNIISSDHPLVIKIYTDGRGNLQIDNNLQLKARPDASEHKGIANIRSRYALLKMDAGFRIVTDKNQFKVTIPLLEMNRYTLSQLSTD